MDLMTELEDYKARIAKAKSIKNPEARQYRVDGLKRAVVLVCSGTAYKDQMARPEIAALYRAILEM